MSIPAIISIPCKTTNDFNWVESLKPIFDKAGNYKTYEQQLNELNQLRTFVVSKNIEVSQHGLEALQRYYDQITVLEKKVPPEFVKAEFTWHDAFDKGSFFSSRKSLALPFYAFERLCILFNVAAFHSKLAAANREIDSDEEMKTIAKWLQNASGIFEHLGTLVTMLPKEALTGDLNPDTLAALSYLMLAQAQEVFVTKAIRDKMKDSIISKLCVQVEDMYGEALEKMTKDTVKYQCEKSWLSNVGGKQHLYKGLSQYFQSKTANANKLIGEEIGRLSLCLDLLKKAQDKMGPDSSSLISSYVSEATRLYSSAKKDNDFIYHEVVPSPDKLPSIDKVPSARLAKQAPVPEQMYPNFKDLFESIETISPSAMSTKKPSIIKKVLDAPLRQVGSILSQASLSAMSQYLQKYVDKPKTGSGTNPAT